jgi:hypothetical protein
VFRCLGIQRTRAAWCRTSMHEKTSLHSPRCAPELASLTCDDPAGGTKHNILPVDLPNVLLRWPSAGHLAGVLASIPWATCHDNMLCRRTGLSRASQQPQVALLPLSRSYPQMSISLTTNIHLRSNCMKSDANRLPLSSLSADGESPFLPVGWNQTRGRIDQIPG